MQRARHCAGLGASSTPTERPFFTYLQRGEGEPSVDEEALSDELSDPYRHSSTGASSSTQEATALVSRCRQLGAVALVGGADERLAARDPAASVARLVTAQCALDCSLLEWRSGRRARARRHA